MWTLIMLALCSSLQEGMRPPQCQALCSENESFVNNVNPCNTCENRGVCSKSELQPVGGPGCDCLQGYYRNKERKCVLKEECEGGPPIIQDGDIRRGKPSNQILCRKDEVFLECSCEKTCCNGGRTEGCSASCKKGCFCKKGLVRQEDGRCIRLKDCEREKGQNGPGADYTPVQCDMPKCDYGCKIDYSTKPCPSCSCPILPSPTNCKPDEQYYECMPLCHGTCFAYMTKSYLYCKMGCRGGCFCREGLYKTDDGRCVPASQCTAPNSPENNCGANAEYRECGSACPPTCADRGKKNKICTLQCVSGCFCKNGFVKNDQGVCVRPQECQQDTCGENEEYRSCGSACPNTCANLGQIVMCTMQCVPGCFCAKGLVRNDQGKCVPPQECPQNSVPTTRNPVDLCTEYEEYQECGTACPATCDNIGKNLPCTLQCVPGCFCRKGLVRNDQGNCVEPEKCPKKKCPKNEVQSDCVNPCNDCRTRGKCNFLVCNKGCDCRKGYYRDFNGKCIPARQCPVIEPTPAPVECSPDQQYYECIPRCSRTCEAYTRPVEIFCSQLCVEGCFCKEGLYEAEDGSCVPPEQCPIPTISSVVSATPPPNQCGADEQFYDCIPACQQTCYALTSEVKIACKMPCRSGCYCREGLYQKDDGTCVPAEECYDDDNTPATTKSPEVTPTEPPSCGKNEEHYSCIPTCKNTCENYRVKNPICPRICIKGCACRKGYVKRSDGKCVKPEKCKQSSPTIKPTTKATPICGKDEEFYRCRPTCKNTCENYRAERRFCPRICIKGCACKKGLVKRKDGKCVKPEKCNKLPPSTLPTKTPAPSCGENEEYYRCIPTCKNTCENYKAVNSLCPRICIAGCSCKKGYVKKNDGKCVKPEKCNKTPPTIKPTKPNQQCGPEEQYYSCIPTCKNTCENYQAKHAICPRICRKGCFCKKGLVKRSDGKCVKPEKCKSPTPEPTVVPHPTSNPTCLLEKEVGPCRASITRYFYNYKMGRCEKFKYGGCRGNKNNFKTIEDCQVVCGGGPTPSPPPKCGKDEEYYSCVPNCHNTCDTYNQKGPCPLYCMSGCFCKKGMVKNKDGKCVKPSKCPSSNPPPPGSSEECGENEEYYDDCAPKCEGTCEAYNNPGIRHCPRCFPGCWCGQGFVKRSDGQCVPPEQCSVSNSTTPPPASNTVCQQPKEVGPCRALMLRFFFNQETRQCEQFNYGGCRGNKNNFKTLEECESKCGSASPTPTPTPACGTDEQHYPCIPSCRNTCANYNKTDIVCPDICEPGCFCKEGMVKNDDGTCVSPSQCNALQPVDGSEECGEDEEYYDECAPKCMGTCEAYNNPGIYNCPLCRPGCWCSEGLVKRSDGQCVSPDQCNVLSSTSSPTIQCSIPKCEDDGCSIDYSTKPCPSCSCTSSPTIQCSMPKCDDDGCSINYSTKPCPSCSCTDSPTIQCSMPKCDDDDGCSIDYSTKPCPSCSCTDSPSIQCSIPKCDDDGCSIDYSTKPCPSCSCSEPPHQCGESEEYYEDCAPSCGGTCETYKKLPILNCRLCQPGCWCSKGLVKRKDGKCVPKDQCDAPTETCSKDEEYKECGSSCPPTCRNFGENTICTKECVPGCFCREGLVRNDEGECVEPEECPQEKCGEDEEYTDCGSACPPTCSNLGKDQVCTDQCVPGCFCSEGLVRNEKGECVLPEECPQKFPEECGEDEKYYECTPSCGGTCSTYNMTAVILCLPCGPGCWCKEGLVKNKEGMCVLPEQCDVPKEPSKLCGVNEIYYDECAPSCKGTCDTHNQKDIECPECAPGCWCKKGYLKNKLGKCVPKRKCNIKRKISQCPKDQRYYDCIPTCKRTCMTYNATTAYCPKECIMGCFCKEGLVMNKKGECVPPEECPITCPFNQKYYECMPDCLNRCNPPDACAAVCKSGCFCKEGLVMRDDGKCIRKNLCKEKNPGKHKCKPDQGYYECFQRCRNSCATRKGVCPELCESGCFCKKGLLIDSQGKCVEPDECDDNSNSVEDGSDENAEPGDEGKCSGVNEEIVSCAKPKTCNTCLIRGNCKLKKCEKGCDCKSGYYRDDSGICIPQDQCPGATPPANECTGENEEMNSCAKPKWCNTCAIRGNCKLKECQAGCDCKSGYYRDDSGVCIPQDECPEDTIGPPTVRCSMPKCDAECSIDYSTKPCPSCSCPGSPTIQCSMPNCGDDCSIDYSTKPCPSCSCPDSPTIQCSVPKCDDDGCNIDYSTKPCPSCSCTSSPTIQCSMPKCDDDGCSIDYSTKPCPSCSCSGNSNTNPGNTIITYNENDSFDESSYSEENFSSTSETETAESGSINQSSNAHKRTSRSRSGSLSSSKSEIEFEKISESQLSKSGSMSQSADAQRKSSRSQSSSRSWSSRSSSGNEIDSEETSEGQFSESGSMNQSSDAQKRSSMSQLGSRSGSSRSSSSNEIDSKEISETQFSESGSMSQSEEAQKKSSRSQLGSRNGSSGSSSGNETDSKETSETQISESGSMSQSEDAQKKSSRSQLGSRSWSSGSTSDNEIDSEINSLEESGAEYSSMSSSTAEWSSALSSDSEISSSRSSSESRAWSSSTSSITDESSEEIEIDFIDGSAVSEEISLSDSESGYSTISSDFENRSSDMSDNSKKRASKSSSGSRTRSSNTSNSKQSSDEDETSSSISEDTSLLDGESGYSKSSSGSTDWSSMMTADSEESSSKSQYGSRTIFSKMSSDFDDDEEEQKYEEYYADDDSAMDEENENFSEEFSFWWTEDKK